MSRSEYDRQVQAGAAALATAFPTLCEDFADAWFVRVAQIVLKAADPEKRRAVVRAARAANPAANVKACREWYQRNKPWAVQQNWKYKQRLAEAIPAPRNRLPWEAWEEAIVVRDDLSFVQMCALVGRSFYAVHTRRYQLKKAHRITRSSLDEVIDAQMIYHTLDDEPAALSAGVGEDE